MTNVRPSSPTVPGLLVLLAAAVLAPPAVAVPAQAQAVRPVGTVISAAPLRRGLWLPNTTSRAFRLRYVTTDARGRRAISTGTLFLPKGRAPRGGWPVVSWAHGTSGLADKCAPSVVGPALPARDRPYLANWMRDGYAIVASDYAGLGTPGLPAYLNGRSEAHNVVDIVKAGRAYTRARLSAGSRLARRWVVIGQSQGGGAAIYTARYATAFGGRGLDYRGAVGTGVPAYIERVVNALAPGFPDVSPATVAYFAYILASLRSVYPELGMDRILTPTGRRYLALAEATCVNPFEAELEGVRVADFFRRRVSSLRNFTEIVKRYMAMPEKGFDKPFFMGHGLQDADVPYGLTNEYVQRLQANRQPLTFKTYDTDHSGTVLQSQQDSHPFVRRLFTTG